MNPAMVAASQARSAAQNAQIIKANTAWLRLLRRIPADFSSVPMPPGAFVSSPTPALSALLGGPWWGSASTPGAPGAPAGAAGSVDGSIAVGGPNGGSGGGPSGRACVPNYSTAPEVVPIDGAYAPKTSPVSLTIAPIPVKPSVAPAQTGKTQRDCRTGNICADIRSGCVLAKQVTVEQLLACSQAGYVGVGATPQYVLDGDRAGLLPYLGSVDLNPPSASSGLSGFADMTPGQWGAIGLSAACLYILYEYGKKLKWTI